MSFFTSELKPFPTYAPQQDFGVLLRVLTLSDVSATSLHKIDAIGGNLASLMGSSSSLVDEVAKVQLNQAGKVNIFIQQDHHELTHLSQEHDEKIKSERRLAIIHWLSPLYFGDKQKDTLGGRQEGTGGWLLNDMRFTDWLEGETRTLWCPGMRN